MIWKALFVVGGICAALSLLAIPRLFLRPALSAEMLSAMKKGLLWVAGVFSACTALFSMLGALWGLDTRLPWGLGIYPFLIPILSVFAFLLLLFTSVKMLSIVLWLLTAANGLAWSLADRATRIASGWQPNKGWEAVGMFCNAFTIVMFLAAVMVQSAAVCESRSVHSRGDLKLGTSER